MRIASSTILAASRSIIITSVIPVVLKERVGSVGHLRMCAFAFGGARDRTRLRLALRQCRAHAREMTALVHRQMQQ